MDVTPRTVLRAFLLIGGIAVLALGIVNESTTQLAVGAIAAILGGLGLYGEWQGQ